MTLGARCIVSALIVIVGRGTHAAAAGSARCETLKTRGAARMAAAKLRCQARAAARGAAVDAECLIMAEHALTRAFAAAELSGPCAGFGPDVAGLVDACVDEIVTALPGTGPCTARKRRGAGRLAAADLVCRAQLLTGGSILQCLLRRDRLSFLPFLRGESCAGDAAAIQTIVTGCVNSIFTALGVVTTTSTLPPLCGNGMIDPGEQCDGQAICDFCAVSAPVCCIYPTFCDQYDHPSDSTLYFDCVDYGGEARPGTCVGGGFGGTCEALPVPATSLCCQHEASCDATVVSDTGQLYAPWRACLYSGGWLIVGTCGSDGHCVPE